MKKVLPLLAAALAVSTGSVSAQTLPGAPETNGLIPASSTMFINGTNGINNPSAVEALSVDIVNDGNVIVGWENDGDGTINDFLGVWTLLDSNGNIITPPTLQSNRDVNGNLPTLEVTTNSYLSFFRSDNTPTPGFPGGWGPKVKANYFGDGMGMGAMPWAIGLEIPELFDINMDAGGLAAGGGVAGLASSDDFPCVQLLNNDGTPLRLGPISGITNLGIVTLADADVEPAGAIRIGGWDYLSSGNILIVGESRQADDRALTGQISGNVPVYRIVTRAGIQVKGYTPVSATADAGSISRHGAAATTNGFVIRWQGPAGATVRFFDNNGNPTSGNVDLATLTGHPEASGGGNGGGSGINSNGRDAYVLVGDYGGTTVWVTVLNANGTVRWSRNVADDLTLSSFAGTGAAIDESGIVTVVFSATPDSTTPYQRGVMGRRFDAAGNPLGGSFYISELEVPDPLRYPSTDPRVAARNGRVVVAWFSKSYPDPTLENRQVIAVRNFFAGQPTLSISRNGNSVTISWPPGVTGYSLEASSTVSGGTWNPVATVNNSVTVAPSGTLFYRLKK